MVRPKTTFKKSKAELNKFKVLDKKGENVVAKKSGKSFTIPAGKHSHMV